MRLLLLTLLFIPNPVQSEDRLDRILGAVCRVSVKDGIGTGCIIHEDAENYYVLSNHHVAGNRGNTVYLEFEKGGFKSPTIKGKVVKSAITSGAGTDVALISVPKSAFPGPMPVIPLASEDHVSADTAMLTAGCQAGEWVSVQRGHLLRSDKNLLYYWPTARPGRSGSPLVDLEAGKVIGLVAWMTSPRKDSQGMAMKAGHVRRVLNSEVSEAAMFALEDRLPPEAVPIPLGDHPEELYALASEDKNPSNPWMNGEGWGGGTAPVLPNPPDEPESMPKRLLPWQIPGTPEYYSENERRKQRLDDRKPPLQPDFDEAPKTNDLRDFMPNILIDLTPLFTPRDRRGQVPPNYTQPPLQGPRIFGAEGLGDQLADMKMYMLIGLALVVFSACAAGLAVVAGAIAFIWLRVKPQMASGGPGSAADENPAKEIEVSD